MLRPCVMLLAAIALLVKVDAASPAAESLMITPDTQALAVHTWHDTNRFLRVHKPANDVEEEERGVSAPSVEMLQGWLKKGLISDDAAALLTLGNTADDLLTSSLLNAWVSYIKVFNHENPAKQMGMLTTLTARFGDDALAVMIEAAKKSPKTAAIAKQVQGEQFKHWMEVGKTPDDIFALLKLNTAKSLLFDQPQVSTWVKYMDDFSKVHSGTQFTTIVTLRKLYTDDVLAKMIITARKSSRTSDVAKRVETELLRDWFNSMKTPSDILRMLNLNKAGLKASNSPLYPLWAKYADLFNTVDPRFKMDMLKGWLKKGLISEDEFTLLTLGSAADNLLTGSMLNAWVRYINLFNKENLAEKMSVIAMLTARFGDEALASMIEVAKRSPKTAVIAKQVQDEQIKHWLVAGKIPDDVFVLLKLNTAKRSLFSQPQLSSWVKYMDDFNEANPKSKTTVFSALSARYSEATLTQMLVVAKTVPRTKNVAIRIQAEQTQRWISTNKLPADIFRLLRLDKVTFSKLLSNQIFTAWVKYTDDFRRINPGTSLTTIETLRVYYTDEGLAKLFIAASQSSRTASIAKRLETELLREWYIIGKPPVAVFQLLNLGKTRLKLFESPLYTVWVNYVNFFNKVEPSLKVDMLPLLKRIYGEKTLSAVLLAAERVGSTKTMAKQLLDEQLKLWLVAKRSPTDVYFLLRVETAAANSPSRQLFSEYSKAYAKA